MKRKKKVLIERNFFGCEMLFHALRKKKADLKFCHSKPFGFFNRYGVNLKLTIPNFADLIT